MFSKSKIGNKAFFRDLSGEALTKLAPKRNRGFTVLELIVVVIISTIILTAFIIANNRWNDQLAVNSQSYDVVLAMRQAQIYSLGVREHIGGTGDKFDVSYGVYMNINQPGQYIFFVDKNKNQKYDAGEGLETKTFTRERGVLINRICGHHPVSGAEKCPPDVEIVSFHLTFERPKTNASIKLLNAGGGQPGSVGSPATIYLRSPGGNESSISAEDNGRISVK